MVCRVRTLTHTRICACVLPVRGLSVCVAMYVRVCACVQMRPALSACPRPLLGVDAAVRVVASGRCGCALAPLLRWLSPPFMPAGRSWPVEAPIRHLNCKRLEVPCSLASIRWALQIVNKPAHRSLYPLLPKLQVESIVVNNRFGLAQRAIELALRAHWTSTSSVALDFFHRRLVTHEYDERR